ncbi:NTF2 fold immunity protein [Halopseudomonas sabulinigri]|uniref:NTF2 fold domain-containing protein n=1 Tax=Halopseudomonas sabulinigri TaxID=472181 RepID=A0ABP9ZUQ3_9GAMM
MKFFCLNLIFFNIMLVCSCTVSATGEKSVTERNERLLEVAQKYIIENYPDSVAVLELEPLVSERDEYWEVTYDLPELTLGGAPVLHISKDEFKVIKSYHGQ